MARDDTAWAIRQYAQGRPFVRETETRMRFTDTQEVYEVRRDGRTEWTFKRVEGEERTDG